jgi:hypothetical protein
MEHHMTKKRPALSSDKAMDLPNDFTPQLVHRIKQLRSSVKTDYLQSQFLTKYVSRDTLSPLIRRNSAISKWLATERENEATADRLLITPLEYNILPRVAYGDFVEFCRDLTRDIIGETPSDTALLGVFSGGASTSRPRTRSYPATKYLGEAHVTSRALELFHLAREGTIFDDLVASGQLSFKEVPGNVMFTVPKNATIDRPACKEPDINMLMQKGLGAEISRLLLRHTGINLNDQSINRSLAHEGSVTNSLATLDLSSASDSVTTELVYTFLPEIWYSTLDSVRSHVTVIDGEEHRNHMFSSMGNGFTFELESLLFYVLAKATAYFTGTRGVISVYGDDIICPSGMSQQLAWVLSWFGFTTNSDKTFHDGPFRESCGGHYHNGLDITPFYLKADIETLPDLIHVANQLRKWAYIEGTSVLDPEVEDIWLWIKSYIPSNLWGGVDTSYKYQLVSHDVPKMRLQEETKSKGTREGGYYHWLNSTRDRNGLPFLMKLDISVISRSGFPDPEGIETSSHSEGLKRFRLRPVKDLTVPRLPALFLTEIGLHPSIGD